MRNQLNLKNALARIKETGIVTLTGSEAHALNKMIETKSKEIPKLLETIEALRFENHYLKREMMPEGWELRIIKHLEETKLIVRPPPGKSPAEAEFKLPGFGANLKVIESLIDAIHATNTDQGANILVDLRPWQMRK